MRKLNFKAFKMPTGVSRADYRIGDARESLADLIYTKVNGIAAHYLAFKIYESDENTEYSNGEIGIIISTVEQYATPCFIDGVRNMLQEGGAQ